MTAYWLASHFGLQPVAQRIPISFRNQNTIPIGKVPRYTYHLIWLGTSGTLPTDVNVYLGTY